MRQYRYLLFIVAFFSGLLYSCREKDDIPDMSVTPIDKTYLQGGWKVVSSQVLWDLSAKGTSINGVYDFKSKITESIQKETNCVSLYFANDTLAFYVRHLPTDNPPYFRPTKYTMNADTAGIAIVFSDPFVLGFYAPYIYVKSIDNNNELTFYLRRDEVVSMMENNSEGKAYSSIVSNEVNNSEIDLFAVRDTLDFYAALDALYGIVR